MPICKCGCGQEVPEGKQWVNGGHAAKYRKANPPQNIKIPPQSLVLTVKTTSKLQRIFNFFKRKQKPEMVEVDSPEDLIEELKPYQIQQSNPKTGLGKILRKDKDFIQVVLVSELIEPKTFWAEKTGMNRIQYKDRMYKLPRDIKGNVFFWHIDKKEPLIDSAQANQSDAESSFHELQLFNMAYSVGRAAGANDLMNNLKLMLIMIGFALLLLITILFYLNNVQKGLSANDAEIINTLNYLNQTMPRNY